MSLIGLYMTGCGTLQSLVYRPVQGLSPDAVASRRVSPPPERPRLEFVPVLDADTIDRYAEQGYVMTGFASLSNGCYVPDDAAVAQAKAVGADLVVVERADGVGRVEHPIHSFLNCYFYRDHVPRQSAGYFDRYRTTLGADFRDLSTQRKLLEHIETGVGIHLIVRGSPAESSDLRVADVLLSLDGRSIPNAEWLKQVLKRDRGMLVTFVVLRHGQYIRRVLQLNQ